MCIDKFVVYFVSRLKIWNYFLFTEFGVHWINGLILLSEWDFRAKDFRGNLYLSGHRQGDFNFVFAGQCDKRVVLLQ